MPSGYYQAPEGQDLVGKLQYVLSRSILGGIAIGIADTKVYSNPKGTVATLARVGYCTWPLVGMSTTFLATTYIATNIRNKDDEWNYALGGAAAGSVFGTWRRSAGVGALAAVTLAFAAVLKKQAIIKGWEFFPEVKHQHQTISSSNYDFTVASYLPGNWTTGKE